MQRILENEAPLEPPVPGASSALILEPAPETRSVRNGARPGRQRRWALILEPHRKLAELLGYVLDFELGIQSVSLPRPRLIPSLFRGWTPDLVIAEIPASPGMPSPEDLELLRPVLASAQAQPVPIPVLLCTAYTEITPRMAREASFAGLIHKPFTPTTLVATVRAILEPFQATSLR
jgi:DNA-binding response OmpR family regulator